MYVVFPIAVRAQIDLEKRYADKGGMSAVVVRLRLPDGTLYGQTGKIDYVEPTVCRPPPTRSWCAADRQSAARSRSNRASRWIGR